MHNFYVWVLVIKLIETVLFMLGARAVGAVLLGLMNSCAELFPSVMAVSSAYIVNGRLFTYRRKTAHIWLLFLGCGTPLV